MAQAAGHRGRTCCGPSVRGGRRDRGRRAGHRGASGGTLEVVVDVGEMVIPYTVAYDGTIVIESLVNRAERVPVKSGMNSARLGVRTRRQGLEALIRRLAERRSDVVLERSEKAKDTDYSVGVASCARETFHFSTRARCAPSRSPVRNTVASRSSSCCPARPGRAGPGPERRRLRRQSGDRRRIDAALRAQWGTVLADVAGRAGLTAAGAAVRDGPAAAGRVRGRARCDGQPGAQAESSNS